MAVLADSPLIACGKVRDNYELDGRILMVDLRHRAPDADRRQRQVLTVAHSRSRARYPRGSVARIRPAGAARR
jgi:hypothetical protein